MRRFIACFILLLLCVFGLSRARMESLLTLDIGEYPVVNGSTATLPLSYALMTRLTGVSLEEVKAYIRHDKTTESFYSLVDGYSDLLLVYEPSADAYEYARERGVQLEVKPIGRDALVFLINTDNPVSSLTHQQILDIYTGKAVNWAELGGSDDPIVAYQRPESSGSQVMMRRQVMKEIEMMEAPQVLRPSEMEGLVSEVASYRNTANAIGYSVYYYVHTMYMEEGIKLLNVDGVVPDNETIASGEYPYTQDFYAVIRKDAPEDSPARRVYDYLSTEDGRAVIGEAGYVAMP